jgi:hypothetical protein
MSYFVCGIGPDGPVTSAFEATLRDFAPAQSCQALLRMQTPSSFASIYGAEKVIPDIGVHDKKDGSWLVVVGTPLVTLRTEQDGMELLREFLKSPGGLIRERIDGNFSLLAYDGVKKRLVAATDFNSTIPIFYTAKSGKVLLSSHEMALAKLIGASTDPLGVAQSIHIGGTWGSHSRFREIHKMLPCQFCVMNGQGEVHAETYWRPQEETPLNSNLDDHIERWLPLLKQAVWKFHECSGRKPVLADFTAGEDGRLLVAQCHALRIPFKANVTGLSDDTDVRIAKQAATAAGFDLLVRKKHTIAKDQLLSKALEICLRNDAYQDFFKACSEFATDTESPLDDHRNVKYCGLPGGEAFRGSYYLRGKAFFPSNRSQLDYRFFTKMKYLLDYHPGLLKYPGNDFLDSIYKMVRNDLDEVKGFSLGTQIDHLLRTYQTSLLGLKYKNPLYLPFATNGMTRSIYWLSPQHKKGGRLTKACTELSFPELASVKTQNGVPTLRRTIPRLPLFLPEYIGMMKKVASGATGRLLKWTKPNKWYYSDEWTFGILRALLNEGPYRNWFSSAETMQTGEMYDPVTLNSILKEAGAGSSKYIPILGRIINLELACRWVHGN